ncbi:MAG: hypothetical protein V4524_01070 [Patescibacteria group bacterium]
MKKIYLYSLLFAVGMLFGTVTYTQAAPPVGTSVGGVLSGDIRWTLDKSPYLLTQDIFVRAGSRLTIDAGVVIDIDPKATIEPGINIEDGGYLAIVGTSDAHVVVHEKVGDINIIGASSTIEYADISSSRIYALKGSVTISSSTLTNKDGPALLLWDGVIQVRASTIENSVTGAVAFADFDGLHSSLTIDHSSIANNRTYDISNKGDIPVNAQNNWWGSIDGPSASMFSGTVTYLPWLTSKPSNDLVACCSSVLFIPGLEASSLHKTDTSLLGTRTNTLWPPNRNDDVRKLFLNTVGKSIDTSIFTGGPIGSVFGIYSIYGKFMSFLDGLIRADTINEWHGFGYDWRKPIVEIVNGAEQKATTTESLIRLVEDMSSRSQTGKVTLVAHSNGGLVSKYLVKALADKGEANLIDSMISVAVPYLGTPQAIAGLLYGDKQDMLHGLIVKKSVAQELGTNMPSAYSLLPSKKYDEVVGYPVIGSSSVMYPNQSLLAAAGTLHTLLDSFTWPAMIKRWAIVGWNALTAKSISFVDNKPAKIISNMGDGTVVAKSASYDAGTTTSIDLKNAGLKGADHATILESPATQKTIDNIIKNDGDAIKSIPGVTVSAPDYSKETTVLQLMTHSPVELHVYDKNGNHVGLIPKPAGIPVDVEEDLYTFFDNDIPGSSFDISDESDSGRDTSIMIPDDGSGPYTIAIKGAGVGPFNFDIYRQGSNGTIEQVSYTDVPTTPLTTATVVLDIAPLGSTASSSLLTSAPVLSVDVDGDGTSEFLAKANTPTDPVVFLESMKKVVQTLSSSTADTKGKDVFVATLRKIDQLENLARAGKISRLHDTASRFSTHYAHSSIKGMSDDDRMTIVNMINEFLSHLSAN